MKIVKIVKKAILLILAACVVVPLGIWWGALLKNYILTVKYRDVLENMEFAGEDDEIEVDFERIMSYSETEIKTYFVKRMGGDESLWDYEVGGIFTYTKMPDGKWDRGYFEGAITWSEAGSADNYVWPYWHHCFHNVTD